jgi:hypothetical protein
VICRHFLGQLRTNVLPVLLPEASQYLPSDAIEDADLQADAKEGSDGRQSRKRHLIEIRA